MRTIFIALLCCFTLSIGAQSIKTQTFTVKGNCEDCKSRIENAADIKGVKNLTWNVDTKVATVIYNEEKVSLLIIKQAIADRGYDAGEVKGNDKVYKKLPKCCQYRDGVCEDPKK